MSDSVLVTIHPSQFPEKVRGDLIDSLRSRRVNHKFHYDSVKQAAQWLRLHQAYSPSRTDPDCVAMYDRSFSAIGARILPTGVHLVGLGCGGGQKDTRLLKELSSTHREIYYTPLDVSAALALTARQAALQVIPASRCFPFVCDLAIANDLPEHLQQSLTRSDYPPGPEPEVTRFFTFFGMIPNFEPQVILPRLAGLIGLQDYLLLSANLAPGKDYAAGTEGILPLYDNALTRDWLMMFLLDLGIESKDGDIQFVIEDAERLKRITAAFHFTQSRNIQVDDEFFRFSPGDSIRLFFSYRYTPSLVSSLLLEHGLQVIDQWTAQTGEEGVFLVSRVQQSAS